MLTASRADPQPQSLQKTKVTLAPCRPRVQLCRQCSAGAAALPAQPWVPAVGTESRESRAWGQPPAAWGTAVSHQAAPHTGLSLLCCPASPLLSAVPVVAAQAEPLEELKLADAFFWGGSQCSTLTAQHSPPCTAGVPGWRPGNTVTALG